MATLLELMAKTAKAQAPKVQAFKNKNTDFVDLSSGDSALAPWVSNVGGDLVNAGVLSEAYDAFRDVGHIKYPHEPLGGDFVHVVIGKRRDFLAATPGKKSETRRHTTVYDVLEFDDENVSVDPIARGLSLPNAMKVADHLYHVGNNHAVWVDAVLRALMQLHGPDGPYWHHGGLPGRAISWW